MRILKNIANTFLAIVLLIATTGITLNKHYCMGRLKSVAVNVHAEHCFEGEEEQMPCCKDISQELKVEEVTTAGFDFDAAPELFELAITNYVLTNEFYAGKSFEQQPYQHYSPPLPDQDITIFFQTFLI